MSMTVRVRPNGAYLAELVIGIAVIVAGVAVGDLLGIVLIIAGAVWTLLWGFPVLLSTLLRVPALSIDPHGIRLPLMGIQLAWTEISAVRHGVIVRGTTQTPVLLVVPTDPGATAAQVRPWLRRQARRDLATHGTPIVVDDRSLDHSIDEIRSAMNAVR